MNSTIKLATFLVVFLSTVLGQAVRPKILCLHGGGGNGNGFSYEIQDLVDSMPDIEFVFATAPYGEGDNRLWIQDPPGGKGEPTQDPAFADASIQELNAIVESEGPFYGLLGYSQGAAFVPVYLSRVPIGTFQVAISFCGYLTETHQGILQVVNENSPFGDIPHLVWMGQQDYLINNGMTNAMAAIFTNPSVVVSPTGGHAPPGTFDPTFDQVTSWIRQQDTPTRAPTSSSPVTKPTRAPTFAKPTRAPTSSSPVAKPTKAPTSSSPVANPTKAPYAWPDKPTWGENPSSPVANPTKAPYAWPDKPTWGENPSSPVAKPTKGPYAWPDKSTWGRKPTTDKDYVDDASSAAFGLTANLRNAVASVGMVFVFMITA